MQDSCTCHFPDASMAFPQLPFLSYSLEKKHTNTKHSNIAPTINGSGKNVGKVWYGCWKSKLMWSLNAGNFGLKSDELLIYLFIVFKQK